MIDRRNNILSVLIVSCLEKRCQINMKEDVLFCVGKEMVKNGLLWYLLIYIFVIQMGIVWYLWSDTSFYVLAGVNGIALAVGAWSFCKEKSKDNHPETQGKTMLESPKEEIINDKKAEDTAENEEEQEKKIWLLCSQWTRTQRWEILTVWGRYWSSYPWTNATQYWTSES